MLKTQRLWLNQDQYKWIHNNHGYVIGIGGTLRQYRTKLILNLLEKYKDIHINIKPKKHQEENVTKYLDVHLMGSLREIKLQYNNKFNMIIRYFIDLEINNG